MRDPFPPKKNPGRILLRCECDEMSGARKALVAILPKAGETEIWGSPDLEESEPEQVTVIDGPFSERSCVAFLAGDEATACGGDYYSDSDVLGAKGMWADLLLLGWMHDEEVGLHRVALELLTLDDNRLKKLWTASGPFDSDFAARTANALLQLRDDGGIDEAVTLAELMDRAGPGAASLDAFEAAIPGLIEEEESRAELLLKARKHRLQPFEKAIAAALAKVPERLAGGEAVCNHIRAYMEEQVLSSGRLPTGVHDFGHIRTGYRSGINVGPIDLDELFAKDR